MYNYDSCQTILKHVFDQHLILYVAISGEINSGILDCKLLGSYALHVYLTQTK